MTQIKPANACYIIGIVDQKLIITNSNMDLLPIELASPLLSFYFKLKAGNAKLAFDAAKELPSIEQENIVRTTLVSVAEPSS